MAAAGRSLARQPSDDEEIPPKGNKRLHRGARVRARPRRLCAGLAVGAAPGRALRLAATGSTPAAGGGSWGLGLSVKVRVVKSRMSTADNRR